MSGAVEFRDWVAQSYHYFKRMGLLEGLLFSGADIQNKQELREVSIAGYRIWLRTASSDFRVAEGILAGEEYRLVTQMAGDPRIILDVGANIGASAIYFAATYPEATIYAFEPEADNFKILEKNCGPWKNIVPVHKAIWSESMSREILNRKTGAWGYTIADVGEGASQFGQTTTCTSLLDFMQAESIKKIDVLKMDIEGGEKEILEHSEDWIGQVDVLAVELHDRICPGCTDAFEKATRTFTQIKTEGEKTLASRIPVQ